MIFNCFKDLPFLKVTNPVEVLLLSYISQLYKESDGIKDKQKTYPK